MGKDHVNPSIVPAREDDGLACSGRKQDGAAGTEIRGEARPDAGGEGAGPSLLSRTHAAARQYRRSLFRR